MGEAHDQRCRYSCLVADIVVSVFSTARESAGDAGPLPGRLHRCARLHTLTANGAVPGNGRSGNGRSAIATSTSAAADSAESSTNGHGTNGHAPQPADTKATRAKFHLAPPRNFQYPAILLLLTEEPRHGYRLVDALLRLGFGPVDRPSVYRALNDLEEDGLLTSWSAEPTAGTTRHVYAPTELGRDVLCQWMSTIEEERDGLVRFTERFRCICDPDS